MKRRTLMLLLICGALPSAHAQLMIGEGFGGPNDFVFTVGVGPSGNPTCTMAGDPLVTKFAVETTEQLCGEGGVNEFYILPGGGSITLLANHTYYISRAALNAAYISEGCASFEDKPFVVTTLKCDNTGQALATISPNSWMISCNAQGCSKVSGTVTVTLP